MTRVQLCAGSADGAVGLIQDAHTHWSDWPWLQIVPLTGASRGGIPASFTPSQLHCSLPTGQKERGIERDGENRRWYPHLITMATEQEQFPAGKVLVKQSCCCCISGGECWFADKVASPTAHALHINMQCIGQRWRKACSGNALLKCNFQTLNPS